MKGITRLAAKLAVFAAVGYGLYFASQYSDGRSVAKWTTAVAPAVPEKEARGAPVRAVAHSEQRTKAQPGSCASQTWPIITSECITGTAEPVKLTARPVLNVDGASSILLREHARSDREHTDHRAAWPSSGDPESQKAGVSREGGEPVSCAR
jgi:hypothetical protein